MIKVTMMCTEKQQQAGPNNSVSYAVTMGVLKESDPKKQILAGQLRLESPEPIDIKVNKKYDIVVSAHSGIELVK